MSGVAAQLCHRRAWPRLPVRGRRRQRVPLPQTPCWSRDSLAIVISQSRRDRRQPGRPAPVQGHAACATLGIVNVVGSSIAREADATAVHLGRAGNLRGHHQGLQHPAGSLLPAGHRSLPSVRGTLADGRVRAILSASCRPCRKRLSKTAGGQGAHPVVCQQVRQRPRRLLHRPRAGLRHQRWKAA